MSAIQALYQLSYSPERGDGRPENRGNALTESCSVRPGGHGPCVRSRRGRYPRALARPGLATLLHVVLEIQEFYGDVLLGTHNVRDLQDQMNDLLSDVIGVIVYWIVWWRWSALRQKRARPARHQRV